MSLEETIKNSNEPEVTKAVFKEIERIGGDSAENFEKLNKTYSELKNTVDNQDGKFDALAEMKIKKLSADIVTRQEELDKSIRAQDAESKKRMDEIEVALQRPGIGGNPEEIRKIEIDCKAFQHFVESRNGGSRFGNPNIISPEVFTEYSKTMESFLRKDEKMFTEIERKAMMVGVDPDGGYVVTPAISNRLVSRLREIDPMRSLAGSERISTDALEIPIDWDEADAEWEEETVSVEANTGTAKMNKKRIPVSPLGARPHATQQFLEDASINPEAWLAKKAADKFGRIEAASFITGNGVGKPRGILTYADGTDYGTIEQVNMGNATEITADGFVKIKYKMIEQYLNRGTWLMNRSTVEAVTILKNGAGDYIWKPGLATDSPATILGAPVRMSTTMPEVAASALAVCYGDFREAYLIVDRLGISVQRDPFTAKPFVEFYFRKRVGGDVINYDALKIGVIAA